MELPYGIPNQEAVTVADKLVGEMFCRFSPPDFFLMFGRQVKLPVDLMYGTRPCDTFTTGEYVRNLHKTLAA